MGELIEFPGHTELDHDGRWERRTAFLCGNAGCEFIDDEIEGTCPACGADSSHALPRRAPDSPPCDCWDRRGSRWCVNHMPEIVAFACTACGAITEPDPPADADGQGRLL